jgi:hypothetical protein
MILPLLLAFGALTVMVGASAGASDERPWSPPPRTAGEREPACALPSMPKPSTTKPSAWRAYFASAGCLQLPEEMPSSDADFAARGDLDKMDVRGATDVYLALGHETDPGVLFMLADRVDAAGNLFAANRLRHKAFRLIA